MARFKIDYGIDLGTTNSSIARSDNGKIRLFQIEPNKKNVMPSCIHFTKRGQMLVGDPAYFKLKDPWNRKNTFSEFKRTMGSNNAFQCKHTQKSYTSEELSAEVLKALRNSVKDEDFSSVIITVPAAFEQVQIEATRRAAELAGFDYCEFLQEPIAASLAFLNDQKNIEGTWLVFDLGGGTFDVALVNMEDGLMKVMDHAGDNHLGGKNMDIDIVDKIILPHLEKTFSIDSIMGDEARRRELRDFWKYFAEEAKIALSDRSSYIIEPDVPICADDNGNEIDTAITVARSEFDRLITPLIDRAINMSKGLILKNNLSPSDLMTVLMVGGPTYIPLLRDRIKNELNENINVTIDPMTVVAQGAALFASTRPIPIKKQKRDYTKIQLTLAYPDTTAEMEITLGLKVEKGKTVGTAPSKIYTEVTRWDKAWTSGRINIENGTGIVRLHLIKNSTNSFGVQLFDQEGRNLECEPNSISILQGVKIAAPPLPHDIGVSAVIRSADSEEEMVPILTKGTSLPATGKKKFIAPKNLRPGNSSDVLKIIIWEGKGGTKPVRNVHMGEIVISGDRLSSLLPEGSEVEITIKMDESRRTKVSAYLPYLDATIDQVVDPDSVNSALSTEELFAQLKAEQERFIDLQEKSTEVDQPDDKYGKIENTLRELNELNEKGRGDCDQNFEIQKRLNEIAAQIDNLEKNLKWPQIEYELNESLRRTEELVDKYGGDQIKQNLSQIKQEIRKTIESKNIKRTKEIIDKLNILKWKILFEQPGYWIAVLKNITDSFDEIQWSDRSKARSFINRGGDLLASGQFSDEIKEIVFGLWDLMPDESDREKTKTPRTDIVHYKV